ncbi:MAG: endonuclease/exonuclease/phosphatase family protein [Saprospiraceae bacterium]|nr:endonuclease/exonuclease/phosphatase family protein [Saprospiraceae bacterium]
MPFLTKYQTIILVLVASIITSCKSANSQKNLTQNLCIGFYNLENLFDTYRDSTIMDEEFTPAGSKNWTQEKYNNKLKNLAKVISELGKSKNSSGPAILGICEIENRQVLRDLLNTDLLKNTPYQIVHYDSRDSRGIDVALFYKPSIFKLLESKSYNVLLRDSIEGNKYTRDVLLVKGQIENQVFYFTVNHWPSRRSGTSASQKYRNQLASINKSLYDSISIKEPNPVFIVMGDLNDNPSDESVKYILKAHKDKEYVKSQEFFNPFYQTYKNGEGSLAHNGSWNLFDQIILSHKLLHPEKGEWEYYDHQVFHRDYMLETDGKYKNYPKRSFSGDNWNNGYSDHFPTLVFLRKK